MKVCVFGAGGRTGIKVVEELVARGHGPRAFIYNKDADKYLPDDIDVLVGNVMDSKLVDIAVKGCDAVISVVGHVKNSDPLMQTKGTQNIVAAMQRHGVDRLISLTGTGAREPGDKPSFLDRVLNFVVRLFDRERIIDGIKHIAVLKNSKLSWTVVRVLKLSQKESTDTQYRLTPGGPAELQTSRAKVARIMVDLVASKKHIHALPVVSRTK